MTLIEKLFSLGYSNKESLGLIMSGNVLVNEEIVIKGSTKIKENDVIRIKNKKKWVSRGSYKLLEAIEKFNLDLTNKICLDVGASTGGFTQVLLSKGAKKIYSLDSGTNQLDFTLRQNEKVVSLEKTNLKSINDDMFEEKIDFICCDVSFISVKKLFDVLSKTNVLANNNYVLILIKPQFEASSNIVEKGGFVNKIHHKDIIDSIISYAIKLNFIFLSIIESPIKGNVSKNIEYLALFRKEF
ncbi:MAG: TlyA family RNA methyltransferase [Mycoplasmataceae bacterium]|nr:TlyA family RNA methyltransferase [Mycoplasmataceae bacterium]MBR3832338.1 TlyA family RNA methyltransferase [Mycoplasmataceae bacterium]